MNTESNIGGRLMVVLQRTGAVMIRVMLVLSLMLALATLPAPLHAAPAVSIPDTSPAGDPAIAVATNAEQGNAVASVPAAVPMIPMDKGAARSIPFDEPGAEAQKQYEGDGLAIVSTAEGVELRSVF